jgi:Carboxypeptidase regulatory-like domain/TonB dependent receptor
LSSRFRIRLAISLLAIASLALPARPQTSRGSVAGTVTDASGAVIPDAVVELTNKESGLVRSTTTNAVGIYRIDAVDLGLFNLKINKVGFNVYLKLGISVESNRTTTEDVTLQVGTSETVVNVNADADELLLKDSPLRGGSFQAHEVSRLPLESRNPIALAGTLPGAVLPSGSTTYGAGTLASPLDTRFAINGQRPRGNNYLLDGTDNNELAFTGPAQPFSIADAVQEVSVQTSDFGAEFGRASGGVVNVITKSGTNEYHGTIFWEYGSQALNSLSNLDKLSGSSPPDFNENVYGFTAGGPIKKNKSFFFAAFQQDRFRSSGQFSFVVPTADAVTTLRSLFPGNPRLDLYLNALGDLRGSSNLFPVALGIDPANGTNRGLVTFGTARWPYPSTRDDTQGMLRLDHSWSPSHQISFRYLIDCEMETPFQGPNSPPSFPGYFADASNADHNFLVSDTYAVTTTLTNELRFSYAREAADWPISSHALPSARVIAAIQLPSPIVAPGIGGAFPQFRFANNWLLQETQSKLIGRHTLRYGFEFLWQLAKQLGAGFAGRGVLTYTAAPGYAAFANFLDDLSGPSGTARRNFGNPVYYPDSFRQSYFFQDTWKAKPSLTLSLGLRYENFGQPANSLRFPAFAGFDPGQFLVPNKVVPYNKNFGLALGVAWSPSPRSDRLGRIIGAGKTVWRAGYQISYDAFFTQLLSFIMGDSPNTVQFNQVSPIGAGRGTPNWSSQLPVTAPLPNIQDGQLAVFDPNIRNPYTEHWSFGLQRTLLNRILLDLAYVGSEGHHLFTRDDINPRRLGGVRLNPTFGPRVITSSIGNSAYNALQLQIERRFAEGFHINGSYTWSRNLDSTSEVASLGTANSGNQSLTSVPVREGGLRLDRGLSDYNRSQRLTIAYIWDVPGPPRGAAKHALGGWSIAGITTFQSGTPYSVQNGFDRNNDGNPKDRPDIGNPDAPLDTRAVIAPISGPTACSTGYRNPDTGTCVTQADVHFVEGLGLPDSRTVGRNTLLTGGTNNWDVILTKSFAIRERKRLEFRWEAFNVFNHRQFVQVPSSNVVNAPPGQFLNPKFTDGGIRAMRLQAKFRF